MSPGVFAWSGANLVAAIADMDFCLVAEKRVPDDRVSILAQPASLGGPCWSRLWTWKAGDGGLLEMYVGEEGSQRLRDVKGLVVGQVMNGRRMTQILPQAHRLLAGGGIEQDRKSAPPKTYLRANVFPHPSRTHG